MRFLSETAYKTSMAWSFVISGPVTYKIFGWALIVLVSLSHVMDLPPDVEHRLTYVFWWLWMMPVVWLVALVLAVIEVRRKKRARQLTIYAVSPFAGAVTVVAVAWVALRIIIPR
jgi:surface polysaccharide O-acyltransferase-like enzyme